jgi:hypothetical protein
MHRLCITLAALSLVFAPAALAESPLERGTRIAEETWGAVCGGETITPRWIDNGRDDWLAASSPNFRVLGDPSSYYDCAVLLNSRARLLDDQAWLCTALVHEWGHLAGHGHSPDTENVMYAWLTRVFSPCATPVAPVVTAPIIAPLPPRGAQPRQRGARKRSRAWRCKTLGRRKARKLRCGKR